MKNERGWHEDGVHADDRRRGLLEWYASRRRDLPWRRERTLYGTWISEIMLQQTTVQTVVPYWKRFMAAFPDVRSLAQAPLDDVLSHWSGLGYYRRARQLHAAAGHVVDRLGGRLPEDREGWCRLPGVGPYASGAIASLGLGEAVPAMDANARRVIMRWSAGSPDERDRLTTADLDRIGADLVPATRPGDWNEAVMELGALVCGARRAHCDDCPVRRYCRAAEAGIVDQVPLPKTNAGAVPVGVAFLVLSSRDRILMLPPGSAPVVPNLDGRAVARSDFRTLHRGLWGLPMTAWFVAAEDGRIDVTPEEWRRGLAGVLGSGLGGFGPEPVSGFRHGITRYRLRAVVYAAELPGRNAPAIIGAPGLRAGFVIPGDGGPPMSRMAAKALSSLGRIPG